MKIQIKCLFLVVCAVGLRAEEDYEKKLTKLWSVSGTSKSDGSAVVNVTSASVVISPTSYSGEAPVRTPRESRIPYAYKKYAFKPRAIPLKREDQDLQSNVYYSPDVNKYKAERLFPGNFFPIAKEKSDENLTQGANIPLEGGQFQPKAIPLLREDFQPRSLDDDDEPIIEKPEGFSEAVASRRSISDYLGVEEDDDYQNEEEEEEEEEDTKGSGIKVKRKGIKKAGKKLTKYMLPLLLAYKLKFFALVPVLVGGLVLLVGATGLAGFFFALFAAVMGLQKGGY